MRIAFMGTPQFAVPSLKKLINNPLFEVVLVITQPDKLTGRKQILTPPPVKIIAQEAGIKISQPDKVNDEALIEELRNLQVDFLITVAYGQILREKILSLAPVINVHASLLPKYRGPAPLNWMIINGEKEAGVTTMLTETGVDTGPMLLKQVTNLAQDETAEQLSLRLSEIGADLLEKTLVGYKNIIPEKQIELEDQVFGLAPFMDKNLGLIDFKQHKFALKSANPRQGHYQNIKNNTAINLHNLCRGTYPWPGSYFIYQDIKVIILKTKVHNSVGNFTLGQISRVDKESGSFFVRTCDGDLEILELKSEGKSACSGLAWLNGQRLKIGDALNNS